jgi:hypothetical protein
MLGVPTVAVGAIVAAVIAGLVSLLGLIISKETKVSEFRQAWIDGLREDVATLLANAACMYWEAVPSGERASEAWRTRMAGNLLGVNAASLRIRLRLNASERESQAVLESLNEHQALFRENERPDRRKLTELEAKLVMEVNVVLKQEWVRVRSGEPVYRAARCLAVIVTLVLVAVLVVFMICKMGLAVHVWRLFSDG